MTENKPILAVETSDKQCGAAVYFSDDKYYEISVNDKNIHSEKLLSIIDFVLKSSDVQIGNLNYIAVSNGPGSFTGLRIGLAAVKGLAAGANIPILPVPTFEALAMQISEYLDLSGCFFIANKVNNDEVYLQKFKNNGNKAEIIEPLKIVKKEELSKIGNEELIFGNAVFNNKIRKIFFPKPLYIARWSKTFGQDKILTDYDFFEPDYIKEFLIKGAKNV